MKVLRAAFVATLALAAASSARADGAAPFKAPPGVAVTKTSLGLTVVNPNGLTLYTYDLDQLADNSSACNAECAQAWPPLSAAAGAPPVGDWKTVKREDGSLQWAYLNKPVYTFTGDSKPGDIAGDGAQRFWHAVKLAAPLPTIARPAGVTLVKSGKAYVLANDKGRTLYRQEPGSAPCVGLCAQDYLRLQAPGLARGLGDWQVVAGADGVPQWAFKGAPLYLFIGDGKPGDRAGDADGSWRSVTVE
ncbi:MAG: hypothetical protein JWQ29_2232 [Phenylobacterium sp.]|nr:hypothetical protein [Phenylobacterium sp.]